MTEQVLFYAFAAVILASALMMVSSKNVFYSALWLALCLFGVAAVFVLLDAYFLAGIQVLIYIGAVVVLAIFVINLTRQITGKQARQMNKQVIPAVLASLLAFALIAAALLKGGWGMRLARHAADDKIPLIGELLLTKYVVPFEAVSVLLLAALIGAVVIVSKDGGGGEG